MIEQRILPAKIELRDLPDGKRLLVGYSAVFNQPTDDRTAEIFGFREVIMPGAFDGAMGDHVVALFNHDQNRVLGRLGARTLRLSIDERGLKMECDIPDTTSGRDVAELVARGDITGQSFGFHVEKQRWEEDSGGGLATRYIESIDYLRDVGPVTFPAYSATSSEVRSLIELRDAELEKIHQAARPDAAAARIAREQRAREIEVSAAETNFRGA